MNIFLGLAALLFSTLERIPQLSFRPAKLFRSYFLSDLFYLLTGFIAGGTLAITYVIKGSAWLETSFGMPRLTNIHLPIAVSILLALIVLDLGNYFAHYLLHRIDTLWQFHRVHHSITSLDWLATFRSHLVEQLLRRVIAPFLLIVIGFPIDALIIAGGIFTFWGIFNHSNLQINLSFIEPIFITPRLHRLHHSISTSQHNLGTVFTIWDRLRRRLLIKDLAQDCQFGNGESDYPQSWLKQFIRPLSDLLQLSKPTSIRN